MIGEQLPLSVQLPDSASFDNFHAGPNAACVAALRALAPGDASGNLLIHGAAATGKTHLLQAVARESRQRGHLAAYLPLRSFATEAPEALAGFEHYESLSLDDVDAALHDRAWAQALLRLLDALRARGGRAVLSAAAPVERLAIAKLPDLRTRLSACAAFALRPLSDDDRAQLLIARARRLGLSLPEDAVRWMLHHLPRDVPSLIDALARLDRAALIARRKPTLPFVQQTLTAPRTAPG